MPVSTPGGTFTSTADFSATPPAPPQAGQRSVMTLPSPRHWPQVREMAKNPCWSRISPVPPQVGHGRGWVPGLAPLPLQVSQRWGRWISMRGGGAEGGLLEVELQVVAEVGPAGAALAAAVGAEDLAEDLPEDVVDGGRAAEAGEGVEALCPWPKWS